MISPIFIAEYTCKSVPRISFVKSELLGIISRSSLAIIDYQLSLSSSCGKQIWYQIVDLWFNIFTK